MVVEDHLKPPAEWPGARAEPPSPRGGTQPRLYELDWLRVFIVLGAMVFHIIYELPIYFPQFRIDMLTSLGSAFALQWGLPLLFLIAGASAWLSLAHRTARQFVTERVMHLFVPFAICALTVIPLTIYFGALTLPGSHDALPQFYARYFQGYGRFFQGNPLDNLIPQWGNLWFIAVIFLFSLLAVPLLIVLRGPHGTAAIAGLAALCRMRGGTLIPAALFVVCSWLVHATLPSTAAGAVWGAALYALSLAGGVLLYTDPSIRRAIERDGMAALMVAAPSFVILQIPAVANAASHSLVHILSVTLAACFPWLAAIASLGLARRWLSFTNPALAYLKEAVFPYFLLHMFVLSIAGYLVLGGTRWPGALQCAVILASTALSLALVYQFVIRRVAFLRLVFGLKPRPAA